MNKFTKPIPDDYLEFSDKAVFKHNNYMMYSKEKDYAHCTGCNMSFVYEQVRSYSNNRTHMKHNRNVWCPFCSRCVKAKSMGYIRNGFEDVAWSGIIEVNEDNVLVRYIRHIKKYNTDGSYNTYLCEKERSVISKNDTSTFGYYDDGWAYYRKPYNQWSGPGIYREPVNGLVIYNTSIDAELTNTAWRYSAVDMYMEHIREYDQKDWLYSDSHLKIKSPYDIQWYLSTYIDYPFIEKIVKLKLFALLDELPDYRIKAYLDINQEEMHKILKLTKNNCRYFIRYNGDFNYLKLLQQLNYYQLTDEQAMDLWMIRGRSPASDIKDIARYMSLDKAIQMYKSYSSTYTDYLVMCHKVGLNMKDKSVLFPADVNKAHDEIVKAYNEKKDEISKLKFDEISTHADKYLFENEQFKIVVPKKTEDLLREGKTLHHCVGTYVDKVVQGLTMILFIRQKKQPDKPYFTLEWRDGEVIQCHGFDNCNPDADVNDFVTEFKKKMDTNNKEIAEKLKAGGEDE